MSGLGVPDAGPDQTTTAARAVVWSGCLATRGALVAWTRPASCSDGHAWQGAESGGRATP